MGVALGRVHISKEEENITEDDHDCKLQSTEISTFMSMIVSQFIETVSFLIIVYFPFPLNHCSSIRIFQIIKLCEFDETHEDEIMNVVNIYELMKLGVFAVSFTE